LPDDGHVTLQENRTVLLLNEYFVFSKILFH